MKRSLLTLLLFSLLALPVSAEDAPSDADVFNAGDFDSSVKASMVSDDATKLKYEPGLFFVAETTGYVPDTTDRYGSDTRFYGKASLEGFKPDVGTLFIGYSFNYFLYASADNPGFSGFYRLQSPDPGSVSASLSEFHFSFDVRKKVFVRVGDQLISWGATYFWAPADLINRQKAQASVLSVVDVRPGKPGVRIHVPIRKANLFLFTDLSSVVQNKKAMDISEVVGQAWRVDGVLKGVQLGFVGYVSKHRSTQLGFDATGSLLGYDLYGEAALSLPTANFSYTAPSASVGGSKVFGQEQTWTARGEFYYNDNGSSSTNISSIARGSFTPFYFGKYYAYGELSTTKLFTSEVAFSLYGFMNVADLSYSATAQFSFDFPGVVPFALYGRYYGGDLDREFTSAYGGRTWQLGVRVKAEL